MDRKTPFLAIMGGATAGCVLVVIFLVILWYMKRQQQRREVPEYLGPYLQFQDDGSQRNLILSQSNSDIGEYCWHLSSLKILEIGHKSGFFFAYTANRLF